MQLAAATITKGNHLAHCLKNAVLATIGEVLLLQVVLHTIMNTSSGIQAAAGHSESFLRKTLACIALAFVALSVATVRLSEYLWPELWSTYPDLRNFFAAVKPDDRFGFPALFGCGLILLLLGFAVIAVARFSVARPPLVDRALAGFADLSRAHLIAVPALALMQGALFLYFESRDLTSSALAIFAWLASLVIGFFLLLRLSKTSTNSTPHFPYIPVVVLMGCFLFIYGAALDSWKFSFIGDEYTFLEYSRGLVINSLRSVQWLEASGSDAGFLPVFVSGYQALFMQVLGGENWPWRFAMSVLVAACIPAAYVIFSDMLRDHGIRAMWVGVLPVVLVFSSELVAVWAMIGKPLAPLLPPIFIAAAFYLRAQRGRGPLYLGLAGAAAGLGMYFTPLGPAMALVLICGWLTIDQLAELLATRRVTFWRLQAFALILIGFSLVASPLLVQRDYFQKMSERTVASEEAASNRDKTAAKTIRTIAAPISLRVDSHFVVGEVIDPVSAFLALVGVAAASALSKLWVVRALWALFALAFMSSGISQYPNPPVTRIHVLMLAVGMLCCLGIAFLIKTFRRAGPILLLPLIVISAAYSLVKLHYYNPYHRQVEYPHHYMQAFQEAPPDKYFLLMAPAQLEAWKFRMMVDFYGYKERVRFFNDNPNGISAFRRLLEEKKSAAVVYIEPSSTSANALADEARELGAQVNKSHPDGLVPQGGCLLNVLIPSLGC